MRFLRLHPPPCTPKLPLYSPQNSKELPAGEMLTVDTHLITPANLRHTQPLTVALTVEQALSHRPAESGTCQRFMKVHTRSKIRTPHAALYPTQAPRIHA